MLSISNKKIIKILFLNLFLFLNLAAFSVHAESQKVKGIPALPGEDCKISGRKVWTEQELWVWKKVCRGEIANFNNIKLYGGTLNPKDDKEWPKNRIISGNFIKTILMHEPYIGALPHSGVRIIGAWFKEPFILRDAELSRDLWLDKSKFDSEANLISLNTPCYLSFEGSVFNQKVDFRQAKILGGLNMDSSKFISHLNMSGIQTSILLMRNGAEFYQVNLTNAIIARMIAMVGSKVTGKLEMNGLHAGDLLMHSDSQFVEVDLSKAHISGTVAMVGSKFTEALNMNSMYVEDDLLMHTDSQFAKVDLSTAYIGGTVAMVGSKFTEELDMDSIHVEDHLYMHGEATFEELVSIRFAKIGKNLRFSGSTINGVDLTGTQVGGYFALSSPPAKWTERASLKLRSTEVQVLQVKDMPEAWPDKLDLNGFTYSMLIGPVWGSATYLSQKDASQFKDWLKRQHNFSPQPYEQLAKVLRNEGYPDQANELLFACKNRELREIEVGFSWIYLVVLKVLIGYGYRIYYSIFWCLGFILAGVIVLRISGQGPVNGMPYGISYSIDMLLPFIKLRESHYTFDLVGWARYYFYLHIMMGYILASFLIAGLSGLTK